MKGVCLQAGGQANGIDTPRFSGLAWCSADSRWFGAPGQGNQHTEWPVSGGAGTRASSWRHFWVLSQSAGVRRSRGLPCGDPGRQPWGWQRRPAEQKPNRSSEEPGARQERSPEQTFPGGGRLAREALGRTPGKFRFLEPRPRPPPQDTPLKEQLHC